MKNKTVILIFSLIVFVSICFTACENPIINTWWVDKPEEPEYIPLLKSVPINYDTVIEYEPVYKTIFVQLPPKTIYETVYVDKPVYEYIYEQLPPEVIYQTVEVIKEVPVYETVYQDVIQYIPTPPDKDTVIQWLTDPSNEDDVKEIIKIIKELIPEEVIKEIIKEIPPKDIIEYLTDEQIQYIVSQQPAKTILQSIKIIDIEYVIFAGSSSTVNGSPGSGASTNLTAQQKDFNTSNIKEMANQLNQYSNYLIMLHGHANPTEFTDQEKEQLETLSINRANDVKRVLLSEYNKLQANPDNPDFDERVSTSGYGGEKTLFASDTQDAAFNRRVEMILFAIEVTVE